MGGCNQLNQISSPITLTSNSESVGSAIKFLIRTGYYPYHPRRVILDWNTIPVTELKFVENLQPANIRDFEGSNPPDRVKTVDWERFP